MDRSFLETAIEIVDPDYLYEHLYDLYTEHRPDALQHLGYVDKLTETLDISLPLAMIDLTIKQSLSNLTSKNELLSTGFIAWQAALHFADWLLADPKCPLRDSILSRGSVVLELGAGVSALLAAVLGPRTGHYVASDQTHVMRLMKQNFIENVTADGYRSNTLQEAEKTAKTGRKGKATKKDLNTSQINFTELDWEDPRAGISDFSELTGHKHADFVIACDTVYNTYLLPFFLETMRQAMSSDSLGIVAMQLRDEAVTEAFLEECFKQNLVVFAIKDEYLSQELIRGFAVYCLRKESESETGP